jgi:hypothetical protein
MANLSKLSSKNQITLPAEVVKGFPGIEYFNVSADGQAIILRPVKIGQTGDATQRLREQFKRLGITQKDVDDAVRWVRLGAS